MESRVKLLGHAAHPMLVMFPLGALGFSVASDALHSCPGNVGTPKRRLRRSISGSPLPCSPLRWGPSTGSRSSRRPAPSASDSGIRHHPQLAELARAFARDLPGEIHVQLYATPAGTQTFGGHYDDEDVFIAQTVGTKDYYLRDNTVARTRSALEQPDFSAVRHERSALMIAQLIPGDWLYIPSRWWHLVRSIEDALSISIGVIPRRSGRVNTG
jgi:hypothetical protein